MAEFAYNNNYHASLGVCPFKAYYGFNLTYRGVHHAEQCLPTVKARIKQMNTVQEELKECLKVAQETMKNQFDQSVRETPNWDVGNATAKNSPSGLFLLP
ncbi:hypothetical protein PCASD_08628 [Puccinia coronata f. sp. avenae]|uniref:Integrase catalytic domain-containing protein n=1 Tax=Puccinia coronata f. sp. avenae TaxID=200324 RepID=A0A2N5V7H5_9BASI|nr:hypothetical protein PCASD_08628 [Puccinia coronata f. sp. avenae]